MREKQALLTKTVMSIMNESLDNKPEDVSDIEEGRIKDFVEQILSEVNNFLLKINDTTKKIITTEKNFIACVST